MVTVSKCNDFAMLAVIMTIDICFGTLRSYIHEIRCLCSGGDQEYVLSQGWEQTVERRVCGGTSILDTRPPQSPSIHPGQVVSPLHYDALHVHIYQNHLATFCDLDALLGWVDIKLCHWFQKFLFSLI